MTQGKQQTAPYYNEDVGEADVGLSQNQRQKVQPGSFNNNARTEQL